MQVRQADAVTGNFKASHVVTPLLLETIARYNQLLTMDQVWNALKKGDRVYTSFSYYVRID